MSPSSQPTCKYIFVTGGVTSSLGKGVVAASIGNILQARGLNVAIQKLDPYLNVDPGTLSPYEHGECFVTEDGTEADLDLGQYERFLDRPTSHHSNITSGRVYHETIMKEREGAFLGKTVQIIPHITDAIKAHIKSANTDNKYDIIIVEVGGCVGDIESLPFIEAIRQLKWEMGIGASAVVHLTLLPYLEAAQEIKTKPTQHSVKTLLSTGLQADVLVCRTTRPIPDYIRKKIASLCNVQEEAVIEAIDTKNIYEVPLLMYQNGLDKVLLKTLQLPSLAPPNFSRWKQFIDQLNNAPGDNIIHIGLIGKYATLPDAYKSINEAIIHAASHHACKFKLHHISSETLPTDNIRSALAGLHGIIVGPGFGERGIQGKLAAIEYVRQEKIPFFGICLGMQCAVIEFAQHELNLTDAASTEYHPTTKHPVIDLMSDQKQVHQKGGTMRLGAYSCQLTAQTLAYNSYHQPIVSERHRHRYEFNNAYLSQFEEAGFIASGINPDQGLVEIIELKNHPWFLGTQFHPEYASTPLRPHPLFIAFVQAALTYKSSHA